MSAIPTYLIGSSPRPIGLTFGDVHVRGSLAVPLMKVCRMGGRDAGVLIRAQDADVVLVFERLEDRDRLVTTLR